MKSIKLFCLLCLNLLTACEQPTPPAPIKSEPPGLVFAVPPYEMPSRIQQRFAPLLSYLSEKLGQPVHLYITTSYEDQIKRLALGEFDLAYMGPSSYIKARDNFQHTEGQPTLIAGEAPYRAAIIVHEDSQIKTLQDLKQASFAFGSYHSYTGHFVVRQLLRLNHIYLKDLQFYSFLGRHERAVMSVVHKDFDAAATTEGFAQRFIALGYPLRVLHTSELLAPTVIVAKPGLSLETVNLLRDALLFPTETHPLYNSEFFEVDEQAFEEVKRIIDAIEF
ncbi:MAG: phosphate/phosphite/phosphonate ABC transporter substrate-binding protein [Thiomicrospira sp.]